MHIGVHTGTKSINGLHIMSDLGAQLGAQLDA